jgi:5-methylcytosine-specific restriction enzyme A
MPGHSYSYAEKQRRKAVVAAHVAKYGWVCPGYGRMLHPSRDLCADHLIPRVGGGEYGPLGVLCRSCNARRGAMPIRDDGGRGNGAEPRC